MTALIDTSGLGAILAIALPPLASCAGPQPATSERAPEVDESSTVRIERRVGLMGTTLAITVEADDRATALAASETAIRALETAEQRLSTWRDDSELARLNRAPVGSTVRLSPELAVELACARRWWRATDGAFDPALGALVAAWDLRGAGRVPTVAERSAALVPGGFGALELEGDHAVRRDAALALEEGGFGKGAGLDAALEALRGSGARSAVLDLGGQVALYPDRPGAEEPTFAVADPDHRDRVVALVRIGNGSLSTSGNSERGIVVDGVRHGHVLDPRTGTPATDFGSLTVWAVGANAATTADALSTGLYVLGPDAALAWAETQADVEVLVVERTVSGPRTRASTGLAGRLEATERGTTP